MTVPVTADVLLRGQLTFLRESGFDITVISSPGPELERVASREGVDVIAIPIAREISAAADIVSLQRLSSALRKLEPDIVNASTAKGGLLGMLAAAAVRVPHRVYLLRGLRLETETGLKRTVLGVAERSAAAAAHRVICVSESLRVRYVEERFAPAAKCSVLGAGSSNGVDIARFARTEERASQAAALRAQHGIAAGAPVIGFVGRLHADKGIAELLDAMMIVRATSPDARLVIIGAGFAGDVVDPAVGARLPREGVIVVDRVDDPVPYYAMIDVLAFPSHREGFPNALLEAAASGVPAVGFRATGVRDAVVEGETGFLVDLGDARSLADRITRYVIGRELREAHGRAAGERARREFAREDVWARWRDEYVQMMQT